MFTARVSHSPDPAWLDCVVENPDEARMFSFRRDGSGVVDEVFLDGTISRFCSHPGATDMEQFLLREVRCRELAKYASFGKPGKEARYRAIQVVITAAWAERPETLKDDLRDLLCEYEDEIEEMSKDTTSYVLGDGDKYEEL